MINLILPEDQPRPLTEEDINAQTNQLMQLYAMQIELEDLEIDAIEYGRLDLLAEIRQKQAEVQKKIDELEEIS
jgi:hypothetical protein